MRIMHLLWLFYIPLLKIFFGFDVLVSGQCQSDQKTFLLQMNSSLNFNSSFSVNLVRWDSNTDCCVWPGIHCDAAGHVVELNLQNESISGGIDESSSLFSLQYLQKLNLAFNRLNYTGIPSKFSKLAKLIYLNLSNAGFAGQIPVEMASLTMLETLDLSILQFTGTPALRLENPNLRKLVQNLTELTDLYLDGVNISAQGKEWCQALSSSLPKLRVLSLSSCNLSGPIDPSLQNLQSLSVIRLDNNNLFTSVPDFVGNFLNLTSLHLSGSKLRGIFPENILKVRTLQTLDLSHNEQLQGYLPEFQNGTLQKLELSHTSFSREIPDSIGNLKMLSNIDLAGCNFSGTIPNSVANLTELVYLDLSLNRFMGPIPSLSLLKNLTYINLAHNLLNGSMSSTAWEVLSDLKILDLRNNSLSGDIPPSLFSIPSLEKVQLSSNQFISQFSRSPNVSSLQLNTLDLASNKLQGQFPKFVFRLQNLKTLTLASNNFSGLFRLSEIQQLRNLSSLDLSYNKFSVDATANDSTSTSFPQLSTLKLASCNLTKFPAFLKNQSTLMSLDLSGNQIRGGIPNWIWKIQNLLHLNLSHNFLVNVESPENGITSTLLVLDLHANQLQGQIPIPPPFTTYLDYSSNNFSSMIPANIGDYLNFSYFFSLSSNNIYGSIPESICSAAYLQVLDLSNNSLTGTIPKCLISFGSTLGVLNLRRNKFNGTITDEFPSNCELQTLDLSGNSLEGKVPKSLASCQMLEVLNIGNNHMKDTFPCYLKNISSLRVLVLRSNNFHGSINCSQSENSWPMLQIVDIASNNFTGKVPQKCLMSWAAMMDDTNQTHDHLRFNFLGLNQWYYQDAITVTLKGQEMELQKILTVFTSIDFSCNNFEGPIPDVVGTLKALYILNMSHNALTGKIPSSLGNLRQLESLDLSINKLTGEIPPALGSLNFLSFVNFSYNRLFGKIPTSTQLQSFTNASFEGNLGLCGPPLANNCSNSKAPDSQPDGTSRVKFTASGVDFNWQFIIVGLGFGIGAGVVVAPILFSKKVNTWYDKEVEKCIKLIFAMLGLKYTRWDDGKVEPEENLYNSEEDDNDDDDGEDEGFQGQYCVFCSKLDIARKRVIHDPKCVCYSPTVSSSLSSSSSSTFSVAM